MRRSSSRARRLDTAVTIILSLLSGVGAVFGVSALLSAAAAAFDLSSPAISAMSAFAAGTGCFAAAFCCSNRKRRNGLRDGLLIGLGVFVTALIIGSLTVRVFTAGGTFTKLTVILTSSAIGGIAGVNSRPIFRK